ncbi:MAG: polysaccharide pyruvyl transferase family protein [Anaerolineales bacterium]|nr:polysaccharide pyruvyl transferase family protein [Anaerolineales bacterium]
MANSQNVFLIDKVLAAAEMQALYQQCDMVVAMRLHAAILALNAATPMLALSYDPKVQSMMEENALDAFVLPLNEHERFGESLERAQEREVTKNIFNRFFRPCVYRPEECGDRHSIAKWFWAYTDS